SVEVVARLYVEIGHCRWGVRRCHGRSCGWLNPFYFQWIQIMQISRVVRNFVAHWVFKSNEDRAFAFGANKHRVNYLGCGLNDGFCDISEAKVIPAASRTVVEQNCHA